MKSKYDINDIVSFKVFDEKCIGKVVEIKVNTDKSIVYEIVCLDDNTKAWKSMSRVFTIDESDIQEMPKYCIVVKDASDKYYVVKKGVLVSRPEESLIGAIENAYREDYKFETLYSKIANDYNNIVNSIFVMNLYNVYLIEFTKENDKLNYIVKKEKLYNTSYKMKKEVENATTQPIKSIKEVIKEEVKKEQKLQKKKVSKKKK